MSGVFMGSSVHWLVLQVKKENLSCVCNDLMIGNHHMMKYNGNQTNIYKNKLECDTNLHSLLIVLTIH